MHVPRAGGLSSVKRVLCKGGECRIARIRVNSTGEKSPPPMSAERVEIESLETRADRTAKDCP